MNKFYVYAYCDPRKKCKIKTSLHNFSCCPFYIGYGSSDRLYYHLNYKSSNRYKDNTIAAIKNIGLKPVIFKIRKDLTKSQAIGLEKYLIKEIGTKIPVKGVKKGALTNLTPGGEGGATMFRRYLTPEQKKRQREGLLGRIPSEETRRKISIGNKGKKITETHRQKLREGYNNMPPSSKGRMIEACRNTKWMYDPMTLELRRIKENNVGEYLDRGWLFGFIKHL